MLVRKRLLVAVGVAGLLAAASYWGATQQERLDAVQVIDPQAEALLTQLASSPNGTSEVNAATPEEYEQKALALIAAGVSPELTTQAYHMIAKRYLYGLRDGLTPERREKGLHYLGLAMVSSPGLADRLMVLQEWASGRMGDMRERPGHAEEVRARRLELAARLWGALKETVDAGIPLDPPEPMIGIMDSGIRWIPTNATPEEQQRWREEHARHSERVAAWNRAAQARRELIRTVEMREWVEEKLALMYAHGSGTLRELREQGMAIVGDEALVERVVQRAIDQHRNAPQWNPPNPRLFDET